MTLSLLTSKDNFSIMFTLSFTVSYGAPSFVECTDNKNVDVISVKNPELHVPIVREVIRSHYVSISQPDITRVIVTLSTPREPRTYTCNVTVEGRENFEGYGSLQIVSKGTGTSTANITGKCVTALVTLVLSN